MLKDFVEKGVVIKTKKDGFILLFAILSISFLLAITINLADSLYKQHKFLSFSSESLDALNNSNAGIECAMYWDRKFDAFNPTQSRDIFCGRQKFTVGGDNNKVFTFTLLNDDGTQSTDVEVDKRVTGTTTITASGYNTKVAAENRVSRELAVSYADRQVSNKCAAYDIVLDVDISGSLVGQERIDAADAHKLIVDKIQFGPTLAQMGVVWFFANTKLQLPLSINPALVKQAVDDSYNTPIFGDTNMAGGLIKARNELMNNGRANVPKFIVLATDGETNECTDMFGDRIYCPGNDHYFDRKKAIAQSIPIAQAIKKEGITIIVVGVGIQDQGGDPRYDPNFVSAAQYTDLLQNKIATPERYFSVTDASHLKDVTGGFDCSFFSRVRGTPIIKEQ